MNVQTRKPMMTAAEKALSDYYATVRDLLPGNDVIKRLRDQLALRLEASGLPTRRNESWHYTDLRSLMKTVPEASESRPAGAAEPLIRGSQVVELSSTGPMEETGAIAIRPFVSLLQSGEAADRLGVTQPDDFIGLLNGIFVSGGACVDVADGSQTAEPVEFQNRHAGGQHHSRLAVTIGAGAKGTFIERHMSSDGGASLVSSITDIEVGERADAVWIICQEQGGSDTHLAQANINLGADARLTLFVVNMGGALVRQEIHTEAGGERSEFKFRAVNLLGGESHTDLSLTLDHLVANCGSTQTVRNVVFDRARGVFQGRINVAPIAQKTDARMACNTLLLSDTAEFDIKPELEIFADDVQCAHGATVADIEDSHLFYLCSRGITEKRARSMLVNAFIAEIVEDMDNGKLVDALEARFAEWLERHA